MSSDPERSRHYPGELARTAPSPIAWPLGAAPPRSRSQRRRLRGSRPVSGHSTRVQGSNASTNFMTSGSRWCQCRLPRKHRISNCWHITFRSVRRDRGAGERCCRDADRLAGRTVRAATRPRPSFSADCHAATAAAIMNSASMLPPCHLLRRGGAPNAAYRPSPAPLPGAGAGAPAQVTTASTIDHRTRRRTTSAPDRANSYHIAGVPRASLGKYWQVPGLCSTMGAWQGYAALLLHRTMPTG